MKRASLIITLIAAYLMAPLMGKSSAARTASALCYVCKVSGGCYTCPDVFPWDGYYRCQPVDCLSCFEDNYCFYFGTDLGFEGQMRAFSRTKPRTLKLRSSMIRGIAAKDPNIALALIKLSKIPIAGETGQLFITPVTVSAGDIDRLLNADKGAVSTMRRLVEEAQRINRLIGEGEASPLIYSVSVSDKDLGSPTLRLQQTDGPAPYSGYLTLNLTLSSGDKTTSDLSTWKVENWEMK